MAYLANNRGAGTEELWIKGEELEATQVERKEMGSDRGLRTSEER